MPEAPAAAPPAAPSSAPPSPAQSGSGAAPPAQPTHAEAGQGASTPDQGAASLDAFADIDRIIADTQQKVSKPPGAKRAADKLAAQKTEADKKAELAKKPEAPAKPGETPADEATTLSAPQLRTAYQQRKVELKEAREKLAATEARIKELEARASQTEEIPKIQEKLTAAEKRAQELDQELRFSNFERSEEYKEKYYKPFLDAYQSGRNKVASLKVMERINDLGEVVQQARKATQEDFDSIMRVQDDAEAAEMADRMFGPMANLVIYHREKVHDLNNARANAIDEYRKNGEERQKAYEQQGKQMQEKLKTVFQTSVKTGMEKYPQWFKAADDDDQGKQVLEKGLLNADSVFSQSQRHPEEMAQIHAAFRNMAGAFPYVALKLHRAETRIKELEEELKQYSESEPNGGGKPHGTDTGPLSAEAEIDALSQSNR